jgi:hypothetical protein
MQIRRPIAVLFTALTLFGGGVSMTGCSTAPGQGQNDGTTDQDGETVSPEDADRENLPDNSNQQPGGEDSSDDSQDPD